MNHAADRSLPELRPTVIAEIAEWWRQRLRAAEEEGTFLQTADVSEVAAKFKCSEEEALRGLGVGEQLHWSGSS